ncbi:hypothetical protein PV326_008841 [Microctonus aethiopoides]|nr:hypothetical protein PV326_008841 [Microctonus aethiopoides]
MSDPNDWDFFVGLGFIIKKKALLTLQQYGVRAGAGGHGYLRQWLWWAGLITMGVGESANFVAYAFAPAAVVTPLGALSIVITAILSSKYLNERLNILGKIGCILCILGSTVILLHVPKSEEVENFEDFIIKIQNFGFISYVFILIILNIYIAFYYGPAHGKDNLIVYIILCSTIGSLTVMSCKGLGLALKDTIYRKKILTTMILQVSTTLTTSVS